MSTPIDSGNEPESASVIVLAIFLGTLLMFAIGAVSNNGKIGGVRVLPPTQLPPEFEDGRLGPIAPTR